MVVVAIVGRSFDGPCPERTVALAGASAVEQPSIKQEGEERSGVVAKLSRVIRHLGAVASSFVRLTKTRHYGGHGQGFMP
jgi:hypothetical protein